MVRTTTWTTKGKVAGSQSVCKPKVDQYLLSRSNEDIHRPDQPILKKKYHFNIYLHRIIYIWPSDIFFATKKSNPHSPHQQILLLRIKDVYVRTNLSTASFGNSCFLSHSPAFGANSSSANLRHISYTIWCSDGNCEYVVYCCLVCLVALFLLFVLYVLAALFWNDCELLFGLDRIV